MAGRLPSIPVQLNTMNSGAAAAIGGIMRVDKIQSAMKLRPRMRNVTSANAVGTARVSANAVAPTVTISEFRRLGQ